MTKNASQSGVLAERYSIFMGMADEQDIVKKERLLAIALLLFVITFTILDIFEDLQEGSTPLHVASEIGVVGLCLIACIYLWRRVVGAWASNSLMLRSQLSSLREDAQQWKTQNAALASGLSQAIEKQLDEWGLSNAEKEVSFALIKGLSFKEIAVLRHTSEHTTRQQAATIYRKSGLEGRAHLAAFFLEDLLVITPRS
ncbi:MAG: hypothetical protein J0M12_06380 [Deltaproteobacteria bacterium]|nr:hypothetical protein [Deltaproteobacteria bacterium]